VEASVLPVSDKPVTLNFSKGPGATNKPFMTAAGLLYLSSPFCRRLTLLPCTGPVPPKSLKSISLGFSFGDDPTGAVEEEEQSSNSKDSKGGSF
jgi:hypothetical protein